MCDFDDVAIETSYGYIFLSRLSLYSNRLYGVHLHTVNQCLSMYRHLLWQWSLMKE